MMTGELGSGRFTRERWVFGGSGSGSANTKQGQRGAGAEGTGQDVG
jgi:hypothetical protein